MGSQRQRGKGKGGGLEKKPMRGRKPREKGLEREGFCFALLCREDTSYKPVKLISQINHSKYCFALLSRNYEVNSSSREAGGTSCHPYRTAVNNKPIRQSGVSLLCCDLRLSSKRY